MPDERLDRFYGPPIVRRAESDALPQSHAQWFNDPTEYNPTGAPLSTHGLLSESYNSPYTAPFSQNDMQTVDSGSPHFFSLQSVSSGIQPLNLADTMYHTTKLRSHRDSASGVDLEGRRIIAYNNNNNTVISKSVSAHDSVPTSPTSTSDHTKGTIRTAVTAQHHFAEPGQIKSLRQNHAAHNGSSAATGSASAYPPMSNMIIRTKKRKYAGLQHQPLQDIHFFLNGHLMTGGDRVWPLLGSVVLLLGLGGLWLGTTGVWIWRDGLGGGGPGKGGKAAVIIFGYLLGTCFGAMMATAFRDPGILPRNLDITYPVAQTSSGGNEPATRQIKVRNGTISAKYCETCRLYRPPRSSHCRLCGNCVEGIDHHCTYLRNCVGKRNYTSFITFLVTAILALIYNIVFSALHYSILTSREHINFGEALARVPEAAVSFILGLILLAPIMALLGYHLRLMLINATTVEQIRASSSKSFLNPGERPINHFTYGSFMKNFAYSICRPQNPSWIDASGWETQDMRQQNPGVISSVEQRIRS